MRVPIPIGTKIIYNNTQGESSGERLWRYKIRLNKTQVETWASEKDITIDIQYYRDQKLNQLLN